MTDTKPKRRIWKIAAALLALTSLALVGVWWSLTRPAVLRGHLDRWLATHDLTAKSVGDIRMHLFGGLVVDDLTIAPIPQTSSKSDKDKQTPPPTIHVGAAQLAGGISDLAAGEFGNCRLLLDDVNVRVYQEPLAERDATLDALSMIKPSEMRFPEFPLSTLPDVVCRSARVRVYATDTAKPTLIKQWMLLATGAKTDDGYSIDVRQRQRPKQSLVKLTIDQQSRTLAANFDEMSVEVARGAIPIAEVRRFLEQADFRGDFEVRRAEVHFPVAIAKESPRQEITLELGFSDVVLAIPLEDWERVRIGGDAQTPLQDRFLRLQNTHGTVRLEADPQAESTIIVAAQAKLQDSDVELRIEAAGADLFTPSADDEEFGDKVGKYAQRVAIKIANLDIPTRDAFPQLFESRALGHVLADFLERYQPTGVCDVDLAWTNPARGGNGVQGTINVRDATCVYADFPYRFEDASGRLRVNNGETIVEEVVGRHGSAIARLTGKVFMPDSWSGFDLRIQAKNVPLNQDLYRALPPQFLPLWDSIAPLALADADIHLWRPTSTREVGPLLPEVDIHANLLSGSLQLDQSRLRDITGRAHIADGNVYLPGLTGTVDGSTVQIAGTLRGNDANAVTSAAMPFRVYDHPIAFTEQLLPETPRSLAVAAIADVYGVGGTQDAEHATVVFKRGTMTVSDDAARPWQIAAGTLTKTGGYHAIRDFRATRAAERLAASGTIQRDAEKTESPTKLDLDLDLQSPFIGGSLQQLLPEYATVIKDELGLSGAGTVALSLKSAKEDSGKNGLALAGKLSSANAKPRRFPYPLQNVRATFTAGDGRFEISECTAQNDAGRTIRVRGGGALASGDDTLAELVVNTEEMAVSDVLLQSLPDVLAPFVGKIQRGGTVSVDLDQLLVERSDALQMKGNVAFAHVSLIEGLKATDFTGTAQGQIVSGATGAMAAKASVRIARGKIGNFILTDGTCDILRPAGDGWLYIENIRGNFGNGMLTGWVKFKPESGDYLVDLALKDVDLAPLLADGSASRRAGRFSASLQLRGEMSDPGSRRGTALLEINNIPIAGTPIVEPLHDLSPPEAKTSADLFERARGRLAIRGSQVQVEEIEMLGRGVRYVGAGAWSLKSNQINLRLFGAKPENWPRVAILTDLLEGVNRELAQFRVTGTIAEPVVRVEALPSVGGAIRTILGD